MDKVHNSQNLAKRNNLLTSFKEYNGLWSSLFTCYYISFMPLIAILIATIFNISTGTLPVLGMLSGQFYILILLIPFVFLSIDMIAVIRKQKSLTTIKTTIKHYPELFIFLGFIIWAIIATLLQHLIFGGSKAMATIIKPLGISEGIFLFIYYFIVLVSAFFIKDRKIIKNIIFICLIFSLILSLLTIIDPLGDKIFFHKHKSSTWAGMFLNSNHIAYYLTLFIGVSSTLFCVAKKLWLKIFSGLSFVFLSFILCLTNTLGSLLAIFVTLIILPFVLWLIKGKIKFKYFIPLISFVCITIITVFVAEFFNSSYTFLGQQVSQLGKETGKIIKDPTSEEAKLAGTTRWGLWLSAFKEIAQSPIIGTGNVLLRPHNEYLQFAQVWGIPAMLIYLSCFIVILVKTIKYRKALSSLTSVLLISSFAYCVSAFFGNTMPHTYPFFMLLLGFLIRCFNDDINCYKEQYNINKLQSDNLKEEEIK